MPDTNIAIARMLLDAAVLAFAATIVVLLVAETILFIRARLPRNSTFARHLLNRPAADIRFEWRQVCIRLLIYSFSAIMFAVTLVVILIAHPDPMVRGLPVWAQVTVGLLVLMGALHLVVRAVVLQLKQRDLRHRVDAFASVGEILGGIASFGYRVFFSLPGRGTAIDAVVVGGNGVFAIMVLLAEGRKSKRPDAVRVEFDGKRIRVDGELSRAFVARAKHNATWLADRLSRLVGHNIVVRTVIVAPGALVSAAPSDDCLLVPEHRLAALSGWAQKDAFLMDDDVDKIARWLDENCRDGRVSKSLKNLSPERRLGRRHTGAPA